MVEIVLHLYFQKQMSKMYINGIGAISAQKTFDALFLEHAVLDNTSTVLPIIAPIYKDYINPTASRRMAKGVKNGIVASAIALKEAKNPDLDAIITGTGMGCIEDSDKFLKAILDNKEQFLTPTSFIQSTHNTVGAQIALGLQCKSYNFTYVNGAVSFESALLDAKMYFDSDNAKAVLVGGIDEMNEYTAILFKIAGFIKKEEEAPFDSKNACTKGTIYGEGATFFALQDTKTSSTYAEVLGIEIFNTMNLENLEQKTKEFLSSINLQISDIDAIILGHNGDIETDIYYKTITENNFNEIPQIYYKHLCGEYNTASAFGLWIGSKILKLQQIPEIIRYNTKQKSVIKKILLYNQYKGIDHSFIVLSAC